MKAKRLFSVVLAITFLSFLVACNSGSKNNKQGFDITGTWHSLNNEDKYELYIKIDSANFNKNHESISGNATFTFQESHYDMLIEKWTKRTVNLSDSDFRVRCSRDLYTEFIGAVVVGFSYGEASSQNVSITFYRDGTASYRVASDGPYSLTRE